METDKYNNKDIKVMVVDDKFGVRILIQEALREEGFTVWSAEDGYKALELLNETSPHIVFMDYKMPTLNGIDVLKMFSDKGYDCKNILMTAYGEVPEVKELEIEQFLMKPFDIKEVKNIVYKFSSEINDKYSQTY